MKRNSKLQYISFITFYVIQNQLSSFDMAFSMNNPLFQLYICMLNMTGEKKYVLRRNYNDDDYWI